MGWGKEYGVFSSAVQCPLLGEGNNCGPKHNHSCGMVAWSSSVLTTSVLLTTMMQNERGTGACLGSRKPFIPFTSLCSSNKIEANGWDL